MLIGIACCDHVTFGACRDYLQAQWPDPALGIRRILHANDAAAVRHYGGLVVHIEHHPAPNFPVNITSAGFDCHVGDAVLAGAVHSSEYLPRLLAMLRPWRNNEKTTKGDTP